MAKVSVGVLARNNEHDIAECLESVAWADERIVILDPRDADRTEFIARAMGARVVPHTFKNFADQREFGLGLASHEWIFYIDTDERATPELAEEILRVIEDDSIVGWWVPRRNIFWGNEIRHGGWYPDYQLRLIRVERAHYDMTREVHEIVDLDGPDAHLENPLIHHNYRRIGEFAVKQQQYVALEARILLKQGVRPRPWTYLTQPLREFWRRYVKLQAFRDGFTGLILSAMVAYYYGFRVTQELSRLWRDSSD